LFKCSCRLIIMLLFVLLWPLPPSSFAAAEDIAKPSVDTQQQAVEAAIARVKPALVRIHVVSATYYRGREEKVESYGSGVIISEDGYVVTNHHVAGNARYISCTMADREEIDAELVGTDPQTDIAIIRLCPDKPKRFPFALFGDSSKVKVGDNVLAMGSPLAFSQSVTRGVVSNTELTMSDIFNEMLELDGEDVGSIVVWIAHDADIYGGNSGGPLVNLEGKIIGINEISVGLGGAIPGNLASEIADKLISAGRVRRSWLGIGVQPLLKNSTEKRGVLISDVMQGSPAHKAGVQAGDILVKLGEQPVDVRFREEMPAFNRCVAALEIGKEIEMALIRQGKELSLSVTAEERPSAVEKVREQKIWGICVCDITPMRARRIGRSSLSGVLVKSVRTGSPCDNAKPSLEADDIIVSIAGKPVAAIDELTDITEELLKGETEQIPVLVEFERKESNYLTVLKIGPDDSRDQGLEVVKAWIPAGIQVLTADMAFALGLEGKRGARIVQVYSGSSAEKAGLRVGDIVVALDGQPIEATRQEDLEVLPTMVRQYRIGSAVELTVLRNAGEIKIQMKLPAAPKPAREMDRYRCENYDFSVRDIAFMDRIKEGWSEKQTGVIAEAVDDGGWASLGGLSSGDLIYAVGGYVINDVAGFERIMQQVMAESSRTIIVQVERKRQNIYLELQAAKNRK
jgi:serine protease Do